MLGMSDAFLLAERLCSPQWIPNLMQAASLAGTEGFFAIFSIPPMPQGVQRSVDRDPVAPCARVLFVAVRLLSGGATRLAYFPKPYPGEILYGLFARCARYMGNLSQTHFNQLLFDIERKTRNVTFSRRLGNVDLKLTAGCGIAAEKLLLEHTLFPYYTAIMIPGSTRM